MALESFRRAGLAFILLLSFQIACTAVHAAPVSASFDDAGLKSRLAVSCNIQQAARDEALRPLLFEDTAAAFRDQGRALVIASPQMTPAQRQRAEQLFETVPEAARALIYTEGGVIVFPRFAIVEALPALKAESGYYNDHGLYIAVERRLYLPFERAELRHNKDGSFVPVRFTPITRDQERMIQHEVGHMVDDLLGDYSHEAKGDNGDLRLTNRPDFRAAFRRDIDHIKRHKTSIGRLGYYFPVEVGGIRASDQRARREAFAELWAERAGTSTNGLSRFYPHSYEIVKALWDYLETTYASGAQNCRYLFDGSAVEGG